MLWRLFVTYTLTPVLGSWKKHSMDIQQSIDSSLETYSVLPSQRLQIHSNKTDASSIWSESEADIPDNYTDMLDGTYIDIYDETMTPVTKEDILKRSMPKSRK